MSTPQGNKYVNVRRPLLCLVVIVLILFAAFFLSYIFSPLEKLLLWSRQFESWHLEELTMAGVVLMIVLALSYWRTVRELGILEENKKFFRSIAETASDAIVSVNTQGEIVFWNPAAEKIFGYSIREAVGKSISMIIPERFQETEKDVLNRVLSQGKENMEGKVMELVGLGKDGREFPIELSLASQRRKEELFFTVILRDITERKKTEEQIKHMAYHDTLTGLPNRRLFNDRLNMELSRAQRNRQKLVVLLLDLDNFKKINDAFGHELGDKLLQNIGDRLEKSLRKTDTIARMGGDEFVLVLPEINSKKDMNKTAQKVLEIVREPVFIGQHRFLITTSIGISVYPEDGEEANLLIRNADIALYRAKEKGRNNFLYYRRGYLSKLPVTEGQVTGGDSREELIEKIKHLYTQVIEMEKTESRKLRGDIKSLQELLEGIMYVLARTTAVKDPYIADHQRAVAQLTCRIATRMNLSEEKIKGLRFAAMLHDIGKINIPSEIINKPEVLTREEFSIITTHPWVSYEILREVEFPWPIADIILQHHERMDGSGYPQGLENGEILLEARILAVADVVEAMFSNRAHRPGHNTEEILKHLSRNKGRLYDPEVVDAYIDVLSEKR